MTRALRARCSGFSLVTTGDRLASLSPADASWSASQNPASRYSLSGRPLTQPGQPYSIT
jgi:hypothetical protein